MRFAAYPVYRPSGVPWLGQVPAAWPVLAVRHAYHIRLGKMLQPDPLSGDDVATPYLKARHVRWEQVRTRGMPVMYAAPDELERYGVRPGDLLVCEGGKVGRAAVVESVPGPVIIQNALHRVRPRGRHQNRFLMYTLQHAANQGWFELLSNRATIAHLTREKLGALRIPLPTPCEQGAIAAFLRERTARVDRLIARKRALTARLRERRAALVLGAVTGALGASESSRAPHPEAEWTGPIPAHWRVVPLGYLVRVQGGATPNRNDPEYWDGSIPWVSPRDMKRPRISDTARHVTEAALDATGLTVVQPGAVLVVVRGMILAHSFPVAIAGVPLTLNQDMKALVAGRALEPCFLAWALMAAGPALVALATESAHGTRKLDAAVLSRFPMPVPPLDEQRAIAEWLDRETTRADRLIGKVETAIRRLREYRSALITAAVTGQIDVRRAAPRASRPGSQGTVHGPAPLSRTEPGNTVALPALLMG